MQTKEEVRKRMQEVHHGQQSTSQERDLPVDEQLSIFP